MNAIYHTRHHVEGLPRSLRRLEDALPRISFRYKRRRRRRRSNSRSPERQQGEKKDKSGVEEENENDMKAQQDSQETSMNVDQAPPIQADDSTKTKDDAKSNVSETVKVKENERTEEEMVALAEDLVDLLESVTHISLA